MDGHVGVVDPVLHPNPHGFHGDVAGWGHVVVSVDVVAEGEFNEEGMSGQAARGVVG